MMSSNIRMCSSVVGALLLLLLGVQARYPRSGTFDDVFASPCPDTFQYFVRDNTVHYGLIRVYAMDATTIQLYVELSVGNSVQGFNGALVLAESKEQTINNILARKPITYQLNFPRWFNYPPKVTKILLNGRQLCQGPPIDLKLVRVLTTINLQHTLRLNMAPNEFNRWPTMPHNHHHHEEDVVAEEEDLDTSNIAPQSSSGGIDFQPPLPVNQPVHIHEGMTKIPLPSNMTMPWAPQSSDDDFSSFGVNLPVCGISFATNSLIANGRDVQMGQFPWLVAIFLIKGLGPEFLCGASLISSKHALTAGHCMKIGAKLLRPEEVFLRVGGHNLQKWTTQEAARTIAAARIHVHDDYKAMSADGDVALIHLEERVDFTNRIRPVCLWTSDNDLDRVVGQLGTVVGWGKDETNALLTPTPKQVTFPVVSQEDCLRSHFAFREITSERTFCGGYRNGSGPCNGDSGGGFLLEARNRWTLRGIVSMSISKDRSCDYSQYFVFTDITRFLGWLRTRL